MTSGLPNGRKRGPRNIQLALDMNRQLVHHRVNMYDIHDRSNRPTLAPREEFDDKESWIEFNRAMLLRHGRIEALKGFGIGILIAVISFSAVFGLAKLVVYLRSI